MKKYEALYRRMREAIHSGALSPGERLPSVREEASSSGLSINTVLGAYDLLADEGLIRSRHRGGFYVRPELTIRSSGGIGEPKSGSNPYAAASREFGERLDQLYERLLRIDPSFATAAPGTDILPVDQIRRRFSLPGTAWTEYGDPAGDARFRARLALASEGLDGNPKAEDFVITNGATEALAIVLRVFLRAGDTVAIESPTYFNYFRQFAPLGIDLVEIPVGEDGMDLDLLEDQLANRRIKMILVQPNVQNPTGTTMSDASKQRLVKLAEKSEAILVQDDVYGDLHFSKVRPRNLGAFTDYEDLVLVSSLSKSLMPGLRMGWIRSRKWAPSLVEEKLRSSMDSNGVCQAALSGWIATKEHRQAVATTKAGLEARVDAHIQRLSEVLPKGASLRRPTGGCLLWIRFPDGTDATALFERMAGKGLIGAPGALFSASQYFNSCIRLNAGRKLSADRSQTLALLGRFGT